MCCQHISFANSNKYTEVLVLVLLNLEHIVVLCFQFINTTSKTTSHSPSFIAEDNQEYKNTSSVILCNDI